MKRNLFVLILCLILALSFSGCAPEARLDRAEDAVENRIENAIDGTLTAAQNDAKTATTHEDAKNIALAHAGFSAADVAALRADYEIDDGAPQYDVHFFKDGVEYEYDIHAETGAILSFEKDR